MTEEGIIARGKRLLSEERLKPEEAQKAVDELPKLVQEARDVLPQLDKFESELVALAKALPARKAQIEEMQALLKIVKDDSANLDQLEKTALEGMIAYFRSIGINVERRT